MTNRTIWADQLRPADALEVAVRAEIYHQVPPDQLSELHTANRQGAERSIVELTHRILSQWDMRLGQQELRDLERHIRHEILGLGRLQPHIEDPQIQEIMVNGPDQVWIEKNGVVELTGDRFNDEQHLLDTIHRILGPLGRRIDMSTPIVNARLSDGSRVNAVIKPVAPDGPILNIRKFRERPFTLQELETNGSLSAEASKYLRAAVRGRLNVLVSGGTSSGKTTLLNVLSGFISDSERIITIEDPAELRLSQPHVVRHEARPANIEGSGAVTIRDLVVNALRQRPDRIVVGEVRGGEAVDMLQAMNTGHDGSLTTAHANSARHVVSRLEMMFLMAGFDVPVGAIRRQISDAINIIVHQDRLEDGTRRVVSISEVTGMNGAEVQIRDIFVRADSATGGYQLGNLDQTGERSHYLPRLRRTGIELPAGLT